MEGRYLLTIPQRPPVSLLQSRRDFSPMWVVRKLPGTSLDLRFVPTHRGPGEKYHRERPLLIVYRFFPIKSLLFTNILCFFPINTYLWEWSECSLWPSKDYTRRLPRLLSDVCVTILLGKVSISSSQCPVMCNSGNFNTPTQCRESPFGLTDGEKG